MKVLDLKNLMLPREARKKSKKKERLPSITKESNFILDCVTNQSKLNEYNFLNDKNLKNYLSKEFVLNNLMNTGILIYKPSRNQTNQYIDTKMYIKNSIRDRGRNKSNSSASYNENINYKGIYTDRGRSNLQDEHTTRSLSNIKTRSKSKTRIIVTNFNEVRGTLSEHKNSTLDSTCRMYIYNDTKSNPPDQLNLLNEPESSIKEFSESSTNKINEKLISCSNNNNHSQNLERVLKENKIENTIKDQLKFSLFLPKKDLIIAEETSELISPKVSHNYEHK